MVSIFGHVLSGTILILKRIVFQVVNIDRQLQMAIIKMKSIIIYTFSQDSINNQ